MESNYKEPFLSEKTSDYKSQYQEQGYPSPGFFAQVQLLTFKNLLITFKNPKNILFLIITPIFLCLFLFFMQSLAVQNGDLTQPDPPVEVLPPFPKCGWDGCVSLEVSYVTNNGSKTYGDYPWIDSVLNTVSAQIGITPSKRTVPITSFSTLSDYYSEIEMNPNRTQIGLLMCGDTS